MGAILASNRAELRLAWQQDKEWRWFVVGALALTATTALTFVRLHFVLGSSGLRLGLITVCAAGLVGYASNLLLPSAIGGDIVKATMLSRRVDERRTVVLTIALDRLIGFVGLFLLCAIAGLRWLAVNGFGPEGPGTRLAVVALIAGPLALVVLLVLARRGRERGLGPAVIASSAVLAVVGHALTVVGLWCFARGLAVATPEFTRHVMIAPLALLSGALPLTPGGLGVLEVAMTTLYDAGGLSRATAAAMLIPFRAVQVVIAIGGLAVRAMSGATLTGREVRPNHAQ